MTGRQDVPLLLRDGFFAFMIAISVAVGVATGVLLAYQVDANQPILAAISCVSMLAQAVFVAFEAHLWRRARSLRGR